MATTKPTKPNSTLPDTWGGIKTEYTSTQITNGYEASVEEVIDGGNLNYSLTGIFERVKYLTDVVDVINATPVGKTIFVDSNNKYDYVQPADDTTVVHLAGTETVTGNKTFSGTNTFSTSTGLQAKEPVMTPQNNDLEGGDIIFKGATNDPLVNYDFHVDRQDGNMRIWGYDSNGNTIIPFSVDMKNNRVLMNAYSMMPNYDAGVSKTHGTTYQAETNILFCYSCDSAEYTESLIQVSKNGTNWITLGNHFTIGGGGNDKENVGQIFVPKGWYYRSTGGGASLCVAYPLIGG